MTYTGLYLGAFHLTNKAGGVEVFAEGTDFGNPEPEEVVVQSLLQDGDLVEHTRDGNRAQSLRIVLTGAIATREANEAALLAELNKRNTLTVPPLDAGGSTIVFDVVTSSLNQIGDDLAEVQRGEWHYSVRVVSLPFGRSVDEVVTTAIGAGGSTTTVVNDGSSSAAWSVGAGCTLSASGGFVRSTRGASGPFDPLTVILTWGGSVDMTALPYVYVDWTTNTFAYNNDPLHGLANGVEMTPVATLPQGAGFRSYFLAPATTVTSFSFYRLTYGTAGAGSRQVAIDQLVSTDVPPVLGTARQLVRTLAVAGTARTEGSLTVDAGTNPLEDVTVYTFEDNGEGYVPCMRIYRSSGGTTTSDASLVSGAYDDLNTSLVFDVPARKMPTGRYIPVARLRSVSGSGSVTVNMTARVRIASADVGPVVSWSQSVALTTTWTIFPMGPALLLPTTDVGSVDAATVRITMVDAAPSSGTDARIDEAWFYNLSLGSLTQVACGSSRKLFIRAATVDTPRPRILRGLATDMSDAFYATPAAWGAHEFEPPQIAVFTVATGSSATNAAVSLSHFPRWHSHAGS